MKLSNFLSSYDYPETKRLKLFRFRLQDTGPKDFILNLIEPYGYSDQFVTLREDDLIQTESGCNRTVEEIYLITKNYFPEIKISRFLKIFADIISNPGHKLVLGWCSDIERYVVFRNWDWEDESGIICGIDTESIKDEGDTPATIELKKILGVD